MRKDPDFFLEHILESILEIERNIKGKTRARFLASTTAQDAVIRRLEIIGEAAKNVPTAFKQKNPDIPWREIVELLNK